MHRFCRVAALLLLFALSMVSAAWAQDAVDCGNGLQCPAGNACLLDGFCAMIVDAVPGSVESKTTPGFFCEPGFRESTIQSAKCIPGGYHECPNGFTCPPEMQCGPSGGCVGGPPPTGPQCSGSGVRCAAGRVCSSRNTCLNPEYFHDCGNGTICSNGAACEQPAGCVFVAPERTRQRPARR
jgi:hypothetical protein